MNESGGTVETGDLPTVKADRLQMRQLFQNLIVNGLKFHRAGEAPRVRVKGRRLPDGSAEVTVSDNGVGFEEKYLDRIFRPFQRLHTREEFEGTGMGLAICQKIVERHGGGIAAKSVPGGGSQFIVVVPPSKE